MNEIKTSEEATIAACEASMEANWKIFAKANRIERALEPLAYDISKLIFRAGFMVGAHFVTTTFVKKVDKIVENNTNTNK